VGRAGAISTTRVSLRSAKAKPLYAMECLLGQNSSAAQTAHMPNYSLTYFALKTSGLAAPMISSA
jgi:hypothetical protein